MDNKDYEVVLNAMPETGVYVIREEDHGILYYNKRVREVSPEVRLGMACHDIWAGSCNCCPLLNMEGRQEGRAVSYNDPYGGVVDITATRTTWEGKIPAFVLTVAPRMETAGYTYRKLLRVDFRQDRCEVLKSDPEGWQPEPNGLSRQLEQFARGGAVHPNDVERFVQFTKLEHLRLSAQSGAETLTLIYRRQLEDGYRWNLMEMIPDVDGVGNGRFGILCVKDVHNVLQEGLAREDASVRSRELIRTLGERNFNIYTVDLNAGTAMPVRVDGRMNEEMALQTPPWDQLMHSHIMDRLHEAYQDEFQRRFSLEGLRLAKKAGQQKIEMLCQWRSGEGYRYISVTAYFSRELPSQSYCVLALQDADERVRQELAHTQRDMQMASILKSRYKMMNTVHLDTGLCDRMNLEESAWTQKTLQGDYSAYIQNAVDHFVHPEDVEQFQAVLSLDHLRQKACETEDYAEEVCRYRLQGGPVRWIEQHVIYCRAGDHISVNILGRDITREQDQEAARLQAMRDRAYIISSLSSLFFSTYYVDLERDSFRTVTQLSRVGDVLGDEVNCTAALQIYAENFVHPDDRAEYLRVMNVDYWRDQLRWWKPYVATEFRKVSDGQTDGPCSWVRATAVLAQTGADDMPKTAVYVAQNISENLQRDV